MQIEFKKTKDYSSAIGIAKGLPEYFNESGIEKMEREMSSDIIFGAYEGEQLVGFAAYHEISPEAVELVWLAISPQNQGKGIGTRLVEKSLEQLNKNYRVCEVKTLSEKENYGPYEKTRRFYKKLGFVALETISPYPGWGVDNPCQIFVKCLKCN